MSEEDKTIKDLEDLLSKIPLPEILKTQYKDTIKKYLDDKTIPKEEKIKHLDMIKKNIEEVKKMMI